MPRHDPFAKRFLEGFDRITLMQSSERRRNFVERMTLSAVHAGKVESALRAGRLCGTVGRNSCKNNCHAGESREASLHGD